MIKRFIQTLLGVLEETLARVHQRISSLFYLCYNTEEHYYQQRLLQIRQPSLKEKE